MTRLYYKSEKTKDYWQRYNKPIYHPFKECCGQPTVIVKYSTGGFIKQLCTNCLNTSPLGYNDFLQIKQEVYCPQCNRRMEPRLLRNRNYGFFCNKCKLEVQLADIVQDINDYINGDWSLLDVNRNYFTTKPEIPSNVVISRCVNCKHFNQPSCAGAYLTGSSSYICPNFSRKGPVEFEW